MTASERRTVVDAATWSHMAYGSGKANVTYFSCEDCDAQCILLQPGGGVLVVAVRGTTSVEDVLCDIEFLQTPLLEADEQDRVMVHSGFDRQYRGLHAGVDAAITKHLVGGGTLVCTGHSLGAGVAALFAVCFGMRFPGKVSYFGYGSPRQGNVKFSALMRSSTSMAVAVKNHRDPVCSVIPQMCLPLRYEQAGVVLCIGHDPHPDVPNPLFLRDHDILGYISSLTHSPEP